MSSLICPVCSYENPAEARLCLRCQAVLQRDTQHINPPEDLVGTPRWGTAHIEKKLFLHIQGSNEPLTITLDDLEKEEMIMGRFDSTSGKAPAIDLSPYQAADKGVSRRHAILSYKNGSLKITDLNSANYTFLNGQKLVPNQARILRDGDEIRLGRMILTVQFGEG